MCGITGVLFFDQRQPALKMLEGMTSVIHHRGPDDSGYLIDRSVGLGFRRLSIIDLQKGHQPLANEDESVWVILNGEIYNYRELSGFLEQRGHQFKTESDTEVLVHLYEEYGTDCVRHLRGMFAFVIWDRRRQEFFAARDYFGIKPFYYYQDNEKFLFGSEIKSILSVEGVPREVAPESLLKFLTFQYVPEPDTMFQGIHKLPPAHWLRITGREVQINRYWNPDFEAAERPLGEFVEELRAAMADSVRHHMLSDVKRGCFLSSGIDSTSIAALMRREEPIKTFTVGFEGPNNECLIARESANAIGTGHYEKMITAEEYFAAMPTAVWHQDEPVADPAAIALYFVSGLAREHVTVVLSGEGADELFGGYNIYHEPLSLRPFDLLPPGLKSALHRVINRMPDFRGRNYLLRGTTPLEERFLGNAKIFAEDFKRELTRIAPETLASYQNPIQVARTLYDQVGKLDSITRMQYIDINLWLPGDILMKGDKMTMAHSLESRVPFLDREVFDVARRIPAKYRVCKGTTKFVLRQAMKGIIPENIVDRPKLGFPVPLRNWLNDGWMPIVREGIASGGIGDYIHLDIADRLADIHLGGRRDTARELWTLYVFALWHRTFILSSDIQSAGAQAETPQENVRRLA